MTNYIDIKCPFCGRKKAVVRHNAHEFFCTGCFRHFDDDPDEGGDYFDDPAKRLERAENAMLRRRNQRKV